MLVIYCTVDNSLPLTRQFEVDLNDLKGSTILIRLNSIDFHNQMIVSMKKKNQVN